MAYWKASPSASQWFLASGLVLTCYVATNEARQAQIKLSKNDNVPFEYVVYSAWSHKSFITRGDTI